LRILNKSLLIKLFEKISVALLALIVLVTFANVIARYVFNNSLYWSFELTMMILSYLSFFGFYIAFKNNRHLSSDVIFKKLPKKLQNFFFFLNSIIIIFISCVFIFYGAKQAFLFMLQKTSILGISIFYLYALLPITGFLLISETINKIRNRGK